MGDGGVVRLCAWQLVIDREVGQTGICVATISELNLMNEELEGHNSWTEKVTNEINK